MNEYEGGELFSNSIGNNRSSVRNNPKIDSQNFIDEYRMLKQQQKDFLLKINMSAKLKRQIFGFTDLKQHRKPGENQKLVTLIDPFKGRLIMKEKAWLEIEKQRNMERQKVEQQYKRRQQQQMMQKAKREQELRKKTKLKSESKKVLKDQNQSEQQNKNAQNIFGSLFKKFSKQVDNKKEDKSKQKKVKVVKQVREQQMYVPDQSPKGKKKIQKRQQMRQVKIQQKNHNQLAKNQYNIKVQGHNETPMVFQQSNKKAPLPQQMEPPINILQMIVAGSKTANRPNQKGNGLKPPLKFQNDDIYQNISQIPKGGSFNDEQDSEKNAQQSQVSSMEEMLSQTNTAAKFKK